MKNFLKYTALLPILPLTVCVCTCSKQETVTNISVEGDTEIYLKYGQNVLQDVYKYKVTTSPTEVSSENIIFEIDDCSVAVIDNKGYLTPKKVGNCKLTCYLKNNKDVQSSININIKMNVYKMETKQSIESEVYEITGFKDDVTEDILKQAFPNNILTFPTNNKIEAIYGFGKSGYSTIPNWIETIDFSNTNIKIIPESAFKYSNFKEIRFNESLEIIESLAFYSCNNLEKITIPNNVDTLSTASFAACSNLKSVNIPKSINNLGAAFTGCKKINEIILNDFENPEYSEEIEYPTNTFTTLCETGNIYISQTADIDQWKQILFALGLEIEGQFPPQWQFIRR